MGIISNYNLVEESRKFCISAILKYISLRHFSKGQDRLLQIVEN